MHITWIFQHYNKEKSNIFSLLEEGRCGNMKRKNYISQLPDILREQINKKLENVQNIIKNMRDDLDKQQKEIENVTAIFYSLHRDIDDFEEKLRNAEEDIGIYTGELIFKVNKISQIVMDKTKKQEEIRSGLIEDILEKTIKDLVISQRSQLNQNKRITEIKPSNIPFGKNANYRFSFSTMMKDISVDPIKKIVNVPPHTSMDVFEWLGYNFIEKYSGFYENAGCVDNDQYALHLEVIGKATHKKFLITSNGNATDMALVNEETDKVNFNTKKEKIYNNDSVFKIANLEESTKKKMVTEKVNDGEKIYLTSAFTMFSSTDGGKSWVEEAHHFRTVRDLVHEIGPELHNNNIVWKRMGFMGVFDIQNTTVPLAVPKLVRDIDRNDVVKKSLPFDHITIPCSPRGFTQYDSSRDGEVQVRMPNLKKWATFTAADDVEPGKKFDFRKLFHDDHFINRPFIDLIDQTFVNGKKIEKTYSSLPDPNSLPQISTDFGKTWIDPYTILFEFLRDAFMEVNEYFDKYQIGLSYNPNYLLKDFRNNYYFKNGINYDNNYSSPRFKKQFRKAQGIANYTKNVDTTGGAGTNYEVVILDEEYFTIASQHSRMFLNSFQNTGGKDTRLRQMLKYHNEIISNCYSYHSIAPTNVGGVIDCSVDVSNNELLNRIFGYNLEYKTYINSEHIGRWDFLGVSKHPNVDKSRIYLNSNYNEILSKWNVLFTQILMSMANVEVYDNEYIRFFNPLNHWDVYGGFDRVSNLDHDEKKYILRKNDTSFIYTNIENLIFGDMLDKTETKLIALMRQDFAYDIKRRKFLFNYAKNSKTAYNFRRQQDSPIDARTTISSEDEYFVNNMGDFNLVLNPYGAANYVSGPIFYYYHSRRGLFYGTQKNIGPGYWNADTEIERMYYEHYSKSDSNIYGATRYPMGQHTAHGLSGWDEIPKIITPRDASDIGSLKVNNIAHKNSQETIFTLESGDPERGSLIKMRRTDVCQIKNPSSWSDKDGDPDLSIQKKNSIKNGIGYSFDIVLLSYDADVAVTKNLKYGIVNPGIFRDGRYRNYDITKKEYNTNDNAFSILYFNPFARGEFINNNRSLWSLSYDDVLTTSRGKSYHWQNRYDNVEDNSDYYSFWSAADISRFALIDKRIYRYIPESGEMLLIATFDEVTNDNYEDTFPDVQYDDEIKKGESFKFPPNSVINQLNFNPVRTEDYGKDRYFFEVLEGPGKLYFYNFEVEKKVKKKKASSPFKYSYRFTLISRCKAPVKEEVIRERHPLSLVYRTDSEAQLDTYFLSYLFVSKHSITCTYEELKGKDIYTPIKFEPSEILIDPISGSRQLVITFSDETIIVTDTGWYVNPGVYNLQGMDAWQRVKFSNDLEIVSEDDSDKKITENLDIRELYGNLLNVRRKIQSEHDVKDDIYGHSIKRDFSISKYHYTIRLAASWKTTDITGCNIIDVTYDIRSKSVVDIKGERIAPKYKNVRIIKERSLDMANTPYVKEKIRHNSRYNWKDDLPHYVTYNRLYMDENFLWYSGDLKEEVKGLRPMGSKADPDDIEYCENIIFENDATPIMYNDIFNHGYSEDREASCVPYTLYQENKIIPFSKDAWNKNNIPITNHILNVIAETNRCRYCLVRPLTAYTVDIYDNTISFMGDILNGNKTFQDCDVENAQYFVKHLKNKYIQLYQMGIYGNKLSNLGNNYTAIVDDKTTYVVCLNFKASMCITETVNPVNRSITVYFFKKNFNDDFTPKYTNYKFILPKKTLEEFNDIALYTLSTPTPFFHKMKSLRVSPYCDANNSATWNVPITIDQQIYNEYCVKCANDPNGLKEKVDNNIKHNVFIVFATTKGLYISKRLHDGYFVNKKATKSGEQEYPEWYPMIETNKPVIKIHGCSVLDGDYLAKGREDGNLEHCAIYYETDDGILHRASIGDPAENFKQAEIKHTLSINNHSDTALSLHLGASLSSGKGLRSVNRSEPVEKDDNISHNSELEICKDEKIVDIVNNSRIYNYYPKGNSNTYLFDRKLRLFNSEYFQNENIYYNNIHYKEDHIVFIDNKYDFVSIICEGFDSYTCHCKGSLEINGRVYTANHAIPHSLDDSDTKCLLMNLTDRKTNKDVNIAIYSNTISRQNSAYENFSMTNYPTVSVHDCIIHYLIVFIR